MKNLILSAMLLVGCGGGGFTTAQQDSTTGGGGSGAEIMPGAAGESGTVIAGPGQRCDSTVTCDSGLSCSESGVCVAKSDIGGLCSVAADCISDHCAGGHCAEPVIPYDGPAWVDCSSGTMIARGLRGLGSEFVFTFDAQYAGPKNKMEVSFYINDSPTGGGLSGESQWFTESDVGSTATGILTLPSVSACPSDNPNCLTDPQIVPSDVITMAFRWCPNAGGPCEDFRPNSCSIVLPDGSEISWP